MGNDLGIFLRARREALTAAEVGLPTGSRRRTSGLRRAEVAALADVSVEYVTRLALLNRLSDILAWTTAYERLMAPASLLTQDPPNLGRFVFTDTGHVPPTRTGSRRRRTGGHA